LFAGCQCLQKCHNKGVTSKYVQTNELAPAGGRGLLVFDLYIQYSGLSGTNTPSLCGFISLGEVVLGLDMLFLGGKRGKNMEADLKAME
jgi:hypothetical protein